MRDSGGALRVVPPGGGGAARLSPTFAGDPRRLFLEENGESWTVGRLLAHAADIERAIPPDAGPVVAVRSHTAAFVVASLLGTWRSRRAPLLVDPSLAREPGGLRHREHRMPVIAPAGVRDTWCDIPVAERQAGAIEPVFPSAGDTEVLFFTSGSTGEPKVVRKRGGQFAAQHEVEAPWLGLDRPLGVLCLVPAFHILGYIYGFDVPACAGGSTRFSRGATPQQWADQVRASRPGLVVGVPAHYRLLAQALREPLPHALFVCSGGPLDAAVGEEFRRRAGSDVLQVYGSTETGGIATRRGAGAWQPFPRLAWRSREGDGRLEIMSDWQERPGEWHCTDDVVSDEGETFTLVGRADSVVKVGGRRFATGEVVRAALAEARVEQAHAVVYERFGEAAVALFVVAKPGTGITPADVRAALATRLAAFKVPRTIRVLRELPTRGIGKIDDDALRATAVGGEVQERAEKIGPPRRKTAEGKPAEK